MDSVMGYGIASCALTPGRKEGSDRAEMVTQVLYGQLYTVLEEKEKWIFIEIHDDSYQCWIDRKQHLGITEDVFKRLSERESKLTANILGKLGNMNLPFGSKLYDLVIDPIHLHAGEFYGEFAEKSFDKIMEYAEMFLEAPYLWGGKSILGIDCSGFCQVVFAASGIKLPRDAYQQAELGETIEFIDQARSGDLAFFDNKEGRITHVGIIKNESIIHASGKVRLDKIDHQGIFNEESKTYTHKLRLIKRLIA